MDKDLPLHDDIRSILMPNTHRRRRRRRRRDSTVELSSREPTVSGQRDGSKRHQFMTIAYAFHVDLITKTLIALCACMRLTLYS